MLTAFTNSWWPVAIYMMVTMAGSFLASWLSPETKDRDLTLVEDAVPGGR
ncbi:hypothetical protein [Amycolatopsis alkalitolerans]|nr:hypothetical protein [Amycolatopsis alkalitolerans]